MQLCVADNCLAFCSGDHVTDAFVHCTGLSVPALMKLDKTIGM